MARSATIYVIDDDEAVRDSIRMLLECEGFTVVALASCADFLRYERSEGRSCIVLDVYMPGMDGLKLLAQIQREKMAIPVIIMTGRLGPAIKWTVERAGAALLEKPFLGRELIDSIERALGAPPKLVEK